MSSVVTDTAPASNLALNAPTSGDELAVLGLVSRRAADAVLGHQPLFEREVELGVRDEFFEHRAEDIPALTGPHRLVEHVDDLDEPLVLSVDVAVPDLEHRAPCHSAIA